jgi:CO/xanthine dehydrogenase Mo-binding subunit
MHVLHEPLGVSRRSFLAGAGALVLSFSLLSQAPAQEAPAAPTEGPEPPPLPGALDDSPFLDSWIRIDADGAITVFTGKAELGQGIRTALLQCAAEELEVDPAAITLITADTSQTPDEGYTAGSQSMQNSGTAIRNAAAQVRELLIAQAATRLGVPAASLRAEAGAVIGADGQRLGYGEIVDGTMLHVNAQPQSRLKATADFRVMGKPMARVDIPAKVTGGVAYVHDLRLDGMLHARVVRPPSYGATLIDADTAAVEQMPGVVSVVRDGSYLAVVAEQEFQAVKAMRTLARSATWQEQETLPDIGNLAEALQQLPAQDGIVADTNTQPAGVTQTFEAVYTRQYQMHGSIGPSCAVGQLVDGLTTVWTHTQGVYPDRDAIAEMLGVDTAAVRCIHMEGSGCYGHNGADDAAADAALLARAVPGRPVRVQFTREQEHAWEPYGPGMVTHVTAGIDSAGRIAAWDYELWSNIHATRPGPAGALISARHLATPFAPEVPELDISRNGNGDRNADPLAYNLPQKRVVWHFMADMPLRVSALRALGAYANVFSIESTMDELALLAQVDPVEFRLQHVEDQRAREVISAAAENFNWASGKLPEGRGRGFAYARYKNSAAYLAIAVEVEVDRETGRVRLVRANCAIDSGEVVNPDGIINQTEGGILQSMSWTLYESVQFDRTRITSVDWSSYPILRFGAVPDSVEVHVMDRPGEPFLGTGEAAQGPAAAAIGNAIRDAIGQRLYDLPLTRDKVKAAIES